MNIFQLPCPLVLFLTVGTNFLLLVSSQSTDDTARCLNFIIKSDNNTDNDLNRNEFISFRQQFCALSANVDNIETANNTFYALACTCRTDINVDSNCCTGDNAKVSVDGIREIIQDSTGNSSNTASVDRLEAICVVVTASCDTTTTTTTATTTTSPSNTKNATYTSTDSSSDTPSQSPTQIPSYRPSQRPSQTPSLSHVEPIPSSTSDAPSAVPESQSSAVPSVVALSDRPSIVPSLVPFDLSDEPVDFPTSPPQDNVPSSTTGDLPSPTISKAKVGAHNNSFLLSFLVAAIASLLLQRVTI